MPRATDVPAVCGRKRVVGEVDAAESNTLVNLQSVEDGRYDDTIEVVWEVERGRPVLPSGSLPEVTEQGFDPLDRPDAFLDAVRRSAITLGF